MTMGRNPDGQVELPVDLCMLCMHMLLRTTGAKSVAEILTIRRLPEPVQAALRERARRAGRSMEAEARAILTAACVGRGEPGWLGACGSARGRGPAGARRATAPS